ncbi:nudix hydrolase 13, mitochondrial [Silene latifolia]|uniref:nudix hydrolase 13, mitochondrial n=1 Tax=Silene latifolia TaxID=37657 RepID=UPI003D77FF5D
MATLLMAREGRHRQLYEDNFRLVSGCIPYRMKKGYEEYTNCIEDRLEVLMISSPNRHDLVFPKGGWENDETVHEAASREALEEAGVRGILNKNELGVWEFRSKSRQDKCSLEGGCRGYMFALEVTEELDTWPEQQNHARKWLDVREAFGLCRYEWMKEALRVFLKLMDNDHNTTKMNNQMVMEAGVSSSAIIISERPVTKPTSGNYSVKSNKILTNCSTSNVFLQLGSLEVL